MYRDSVHMILLFLLEKNLYLVCQLLCISMINKVLFVKSQKKYWKIISNKKINRTTKIVTFFVVRLQE